MEERYIVNAIKSAEKKKYAEGRAEGIKEGRAESIAEVARTMLAKGMDVAVISEITGLTPEQINNLV